MLPTRRSAILIPFFLCRSVMLFCECVWRYCDETKSFEEAESSAQLVEVEEKEEGEGGVEKDNCRASAICAVAARVDPRQ